MPPSVVNSDVVAVTIVWQLVFYLRFVVYYAVFGLVIILCLFAVCCLTECVFVVASVIVVLLCRD